MPTSPVASHTRTHPLPSVPATVPPGFRRDAHAPPPPPPWWTRLYGPTGTGDPITPKETVR